MIRGRVLIIAGSDSGGGAGIQADIKSVMAMGGFAATAITAITAQNTMGVHAVMQVPPALVRQQIEVVLDDIGADAIKIGMLGNAETIASVADTLERQLSRCPLVLDPVMIAKGGAPLIAADAVETLLRRLVPLATVITPNLPEAAALLGRPVDDQTEAALALRGLGAHAVLLKGGHANGAVVQDVLAHAGGIEIFARPRIDTKHTHGTGCTLASAVAAGLAQHLNLADAVARAHRYVQAAIQTAPGFGSGHGPLNHNARYDP